MAGQPPRRARISESRAFEGALRRGTLERHWSRHRRAGGRAARRRGEPPRERRASATTAAMAEQAVWCVRASNEAKESVERRRRCDTVGARARPENAAAWARPEGAEGARGWLRVGWGITGGRGHLGSLANASRGAERGVATPRRLREPRDMARVQLPPLGGDIHITQQPHVHWSVARCGTIAGSRNASYDAALLNSRAAHRNSHVECECVFVRLVLVAGGGTRPQLFGATQRLSCVSPSGLVLGACARVNMRVHVQTRRVHTRQPRAARRRSISESYRRRWTV